MLSFGLILFCLGLGIFFRAFRIFPENSAQVLNRFVIYISLPALTLKELHKLSIGTSGMAAVAMPWVLFLFGTLFFWSVSLLRSMDRKTLGTLMLTGSLGNTSFVGFPLLEALFGAGALSIGVLVDQPGTFLVAGTLGIFIASYFSGAKPKLRTVLSKVLFFPPFQAVVLALLLRPVAFPEGLNSFLDKLAATLIPLALVSVGFQLRADRENLRREWRALALGLTFKLFLAPLFILILYAGVLGLHGEDTQVVLAESAMAPMITSGIIAAEYGLNAELASLMIGMGIPLSLLTVPVWKWVVAGVVG